MLIDGILYFAPIIREPITDGQLMITAGGALDEIGNIAYALSSGEIPLPINIIEAKLLTPNCARKE